MSDYQKSIFYFLNFCVLITALAGYDLRQALVKARGEVYGKEVFHRRIGKMISRTTKLASHGGDRKSEEFKGRVG